MLIFPEGGRSPDGWGQPFRGGAAYLASRCSVPVVPVHVDGTGPILRKGSTVPKPAATRITFGHPMHPEPGEDSRRLGARIEESVATLADEADHRLVAGAPTGPRRDNTGADRARCPDLAPCVGDRNPDASQARHTPRLA